MYIENDIYISPDYTRRDYVFIRLDAQSPADSWSKAIEILKDRIYGRYLDPVDELISSDPNRNGFAAMSLLCLLIDTFMQFRFGYPDSSRDSRNGERYARFLRDCLGFNPREAQSFYTDIRCGLLHSAETMNGSYLCPRFNHNGRAIESFYIERRMILKVSVQGMHQVLKEYFDKYCDELMAGSDTEIRKNFVMKMDDISMKYDELNGDYELWLAIRNGSAKELQDFTGSPFSYHISNYNRSLIIDKDGKRGYAVIPFSELKQFLYYPGKRGLSIENSWFIQSILNAFPSEVRRYTQSAWC